MGSVGPTMPWKGYGFHILGWPDEKTQHQQSLDARAWRLLAGELPTLHQQWQSAVENVGLGNSWKRIRTTRSRSVWGQYVLSNMDPAERRGCEKELIQGYFNELTSSGKVDMTWDKCWNEYRIGGLERWLWFLVYFAGQTGPLLNWGQLFHDQVKSFLYDHKVTPDEIGLPRPWATFRHFPSTNSFYSNEYDNRIQHRLCIYIRWWAHFLVLLSLGVVQQFILHLATKIGTSPMRWEYNC